MVHVQVTGDTAVEANETLTLTLSSPNGATLAHGTATGTIVNDDTAPLPTLSVGDSSFAEGSAAAPGHGSFTVSLSSAATAPVTVHFATADGTATAGSDYVAQSGTLTFAAGETQKTITVAAIGDSTVEANESFTVTLASPTGATIAHGTGSGTIVNDDTAPPPPPPTLSISDTSVVEGNPGGTAGAGLAQHVGQPDRRQRRTLRADRRRQLVRLRIDQHVAPHGLWTRSYKDMMDQMMELGFNTIRLPFSSDMLHSTAAPNGIDFSKNPDLQGLIGAADHGQDRRLCRPDRAADHPRPSSHRAGAGTSANGLWYDAKHSQAAMDHRLEDAGAALCRQPDRDRRRPAQRAVQRHLGRRRPQRLAAAAERAGNAIGAVNPNWLIFVEGVGTYQGQSYWWGGNLMGVKDPPVVLNVPNKLVYSPHDYPDSVYQQPWFSDPSYPANLPAKFAQMWGYIYQAGHRAGLPGRVRHQAGRSQGCALAPGDHLLSRRRFQQ